MFILRFFFKATFDNDLSPRDAVAAGLKASDVAGLLKLREQAYAFIDAVNEELVARPELEHR